MRLGNEFNGGFPMIDIRKEEPADQEAVRQINDIAFVQGSEVAIVDKLRKSCKTIVRLWLSIRILS
ncbi:hypothetical protein CR164_11880 [Prosthecochloris marina]|uniref:Uncharacterized protein n=1 Tax=Prosthecochloris marina TaxID=2017681 RepID=A0A317T4F8_9CHLB|nr:hypothetical protein CR164_11880 [Prosthecochloris marina]